jgi:hypothetical protein
MIARNTAAGAQMRYENAAGVVAGGGEAAADLGARVIEPQILLHEVEPEKTGFCHCWYNNRRARDLR